MTNFVGTTGDDILTGTSANDVFGLIQGGDDTAAGLGGNDTFKFGATFTAADSVDGGAGADTLELDGDYTAAVTLGAATLQNVETVVLDAGFDYALKMNDANVAAGATLSVNASKLGAANRLDFDGTQEQDGSYHLIGGAGNDILRGGGSADTIDISLGGTDQALGGGGNDSILGGAAVTAADSIDGGAGVDTLTLNGDYTGAHALVLTPTTITSVETLLLTRGSSYDITAGSLANPFLTVDAHGLKPADSLSFDAAGQTGAMHIIGGQGDDHLTGGDGSGDIFDLSYGGDDSATGGAGNDIFEMGKAYTEDDRIDGGGGTNTVVLNGPYVELELTPTDIKNIQILQIDGAHAVYVDLDDGAIPDGSTLDINIDNSRYIVVDADEDSGANYNFTGGSGHEVLRGGAGNDIFTMSGDVTSVGGQGGDDITYMGSSLTAGDHINGGSGTDTVVLQGGAPLVFTNHTLLGVEILQLDDVAKSNYRYEITTVDATVTGSQTLTVEASSNALIFDGSAEKAGRFSIIGGSGDLQATGGAGNDAFVAGSGANSFKGGAGADDYTAGGTSDRFAFAAASDSTGAAHDTIHALDFATATFALAHSVKAIDAAVTTGRLDAGASFDGKLSAALGASQLHVHDAVLFTASSGSLSGHTFLVVNLDGTAGYQAGGDLVVDVTGASGTLTTGDFIVGR